jgi:hypothetical protein
MERVAKFVGWYIYITNLLSGLDGPGGLGHDLQR